mmetsp:Transcript_6929/g.19561  ORF Transcript_6929/g.19561 Transcript_6929/m.19561 type:complete len:581 (-) Transcript_6929:750-2492(-)
MSSEQNPSFPAEPADAPPEPGMPVKLTCCSSLALPEGSDLTGLQCEFSGTPSACVPASYEGGAITCIAPWQLEKDLSVKVKTLKGDVLCEETIRLAALSQPLLEAPESPCSVDVPEGEAPKRGMVQYMKNHYSALKPFVIISSSYLLFTVTDGAVRMIVLLHAYNLGFSAFETALLFMLYELAGVVTNLLAGAAGARWGIKTTLLTGLSFQLLGFAMLMGWQNEWGEPGNRWKGMLYVTIAQMWCGIAKDLTKLGGKTVTKLVTPDEKQSKLFKLVSFITGFKNSLKGLGYFLGSALVAINYYLALGVMMGLVVLAMPWAVFGLSKELGQTRKENITLSAIFKQSSNINWLSAARFFLFGSRDLWFEVPLPFFLRVSHCWPTVPRTHCWHTIPGTHPRERERIYTLTSRHAPISCDASAWCHLAGAGATGHVFWRRPQPHRCGDIPGTVDHHLRAGPIVVAAAHSQPPEAGATLHYQQVCGGAVVGNSDGLPYLSVCSDAWDRHLLPSIRVFSQDVHHDSWTGRLLHHLCHQQQRPQLPRCALQRRQHGKRHGLLDHAPPHSISPSMSPSMWSQPQVSFE